MAMKDVRAVFIDTNILIRAYISEAPLHQECLEAIRKLRVRGDDLWISRQILREYMSVVTRPQGFISPQPIATIVEDIAYFQSHFHIADENSSVTRHLLSLVEQIPMGGKQVHGANIVATMLTYGVSHLLTLNTADFRRFGELITVLSLEDIQAEQAEESDAE